MSLPTRNNPYNFDEYLAWRSRVDYYRDDPFFNNYSGISVVTSGNLSTKT